MGRPRSGAAREAPGGGGLPRSRAIQVVLGLLVIGLGAWTFVKARGVPHHADVVIASRVLVASFAALGLSLILLGAWIPARGGFRPLLLVFGRDEGRAVRGAVPAMGYAVGLIAALAGGFYALPPLWQLDAADDLTLRSRTKTGQPGTLLTTNMRVGAAIFAGGLTLAGAFAWAERRRAAKLARTLLGPAIDPPRDGFARIEGRAVGAGRNPHIVCTVSRRSFGKGDSRNGTWSRFEGSSFKLESPRGILVVRASRAEFASAFMREHTREKGHDVEWTLPPGATVRIAGRVTTLDGEGSASSPGPTGPALVLDADTEGSLVIYAAPEGSSITRAIWVHQLTHVALTLVAISAPVALVHAIVGG